MPGFWHVEMTMKGGRKKRLSVNHRSKRAATKYADVEGAVDWKLFQSAVRLPAPRKS
jgi:hypothetical protein